MSDAIRATDWEGADAFVERIRHYNPTVNEAKVRKALLFSEKAHEHQRRESGERYFLHPLAVANILVDMKMDTYSIVTALLHDTVEDTDISLEEIGQEFGEEVMRLVDGVTKLAKIEFQSDKVRQAENFRKLLLAMSEDIRVLLVKLADRLHNMRTLHCCKSPEKRQRIAHETMEIYSPLAERLGIHHIKNELQDLAFAELHGEVRESIITRLEFLKKEDDKIIQSIISQLQETLDLHDVNGEVQGRVKTPVSIWRKMESKNVGFEQLADIMAFRVITGSIEDCYKVLGALHSEYHMIPDTFKDYISTPKNNGYQSLHTNIIGPEKKCIEVQIRTQEMHDVAEFGVAAHWSYKQGQTYGPDGKQFKWLQELLNILERADDPEEFLENTKMEMYYDQVFCFTPRGDLIAMPRGATPVDFAYAVHSDVGNSCVGSKINGRIVPLRTQLQNGDQVEIICSNTQVPSPSWESFVVTGKARAEVRKFIRMQQRDDYIHLGHSILVKALRKEGWDLKDKLLEPHLEFFQKEAVEDLYAAVGEGTIARSDVVQRVVPGAKAPNESRKQIFNIFKRLGDNKQKQQKNTKETVPIKGLISGMAVHFAGCCHPIPGERIVGIVNTGKGITIHTTDCDVLANYADTPERWIEVSWESDSHEGRHIGRIKMVLNHESGALAVVTNTIAKDLGNINNLKITNRSPDFFEIMIDIEVSGTRHLTNIIASLRAQACVHSVERYKH